ncbi:homoserine kinase [Jatrophihabitans telluris]|uniref:Homoserine kinase n=1 Tax=Jatrophihabitans telluris TaxID=2038343 RepID=A0ABY4R1P7_9ACTN|nr:homoserine kinase [Jatrophihabitans telluris]UQX89853.1 homoserine kinase [Jatrophihabitans telluris]
MFRTGPVTVEVPATSANLGPGFDAFGLALDLTDTVTAELVPGGLEIEAAGEGADAVPVDESHLIIRSMRSTFDRLGGQPAGLRLTSENRIPHGRGLGSSAAAIVAGVLLARALVRGGAEQFDDAEVLALASELEGHPDNVAACLLGGFTIAWTTDGRGRAVRSEPKGVHPVLFIATESSSTHTARAALPPSVPHPDAAFNAARSALLALALTQGRTELLMSATEDRLHQPYRAAAMPASSALVAELRRAGIPAVISGAGSSVLALVGDQDQVTPARAYTPQGWRSLALAIGEGAALTAS